MITNFISMLAIIKTGGKQYKVEEGDVLKVERLNKKKGDNVEFSDVLLTAEKDGTKLKIGTPKLAGAKVMAKVIDEAKAKKITVIKYKSKTRYRRKKGHRQWLTALKVEKIVA